MNQYSYNRSSRSAYMYGSAAPDYRQREQSQLEVIHGTRPDQGTGVLPEGIIRASIVMALVFVLVAAVCMVRVQLAVASQDECIAADALMVEIDSTRTHANDLEVQQSYMSTDTHIRNAATQLGMEAPVSTTTLVLEEDVVATDAAGNLSLSGSLSAMSQQG